MFVYLMLNSIFFPLLYNIFTITRRDGEYIHEHTHYGWNIYYLFINIYFNHDTHWMSLETRIR